MSPRQQLSSVPYAMRASRANEALSATTAAVANSIANNTVNSSKIVDGSIGSADIANNAVIEQRILDGAVTQAKAPWAPVIRNKNGSSNIANPKFTYGQDTSSAGNFTITFPSGYFISAPAVLCTSAHNGDAHLVMVNTVTTTTATIKTYVWNGSQYAQGGDIWFYWLAIGQ